ncbi:hypothetical protein ACQCN2_20360 [Brevibacillus ginsengisoli]|uniref:hypothetical protein n=1 Tax=Brevibacillus ginsengisoli TaxID=363854 RepID=UPI003CF2DD31
MKRHRKSYKTWAKSVLATTLGLLVLLVGLNYVVDPLQFFHKAYMKPDFSDQQRYQNPGIAKNYDYNTIIIGTSMTENFLPSYVNEKLGVQAVKLSMSGSTAMEQRIMINHAVRTGKVKTILWGVDYFSLRGDPNRVRQEFGEFPYYLYDQNPWNDLKYLVNLDTSQQALHWIGIQAGVAQPANPSLNLLNTWESPDLFGRENVMNEWNKLKEGGSFKPSEYEMKQVQKNMDNNLLSVIKAHPDVQFVLYYPPYSILQHRYFYDKDPSFFENELYVKKYLFEQVGKQPNVKIYDFQQEQKITFDLNNYKDLAHHSRKVNEWIIDQIAQDKYRVTKKTLPVYLDQLREQVVNLKEGNF